MSTYYDVTLAAVSGCYDIYLNATETLDVYFSNVSDIYDTYLNDASGCYDIYIPSRDYEAEFIVTCLRQSKTLIPETSYMYIYCNPVDMEDNAYPSARIEMYLSLSVDEEKYSYDGADITTYISANASIVRAVITDVEFDTYTSASCTATLTTLKYLYELDDYDLATFDEDTLYDTTYTILE